MNAYKPMTSEEAMALATQDTMLTPRFYTTDFDALDAIDVSPVRAEWDVLIADMVGDPNKLHFKHSDRFKGVIEGLEPALRQEFTDFLVSSMTSEFSGCVLYAEIARRTKNPDVKQLFRLLARDERNRPNDTDDPARPRVGRGGAPGCRDLLGSRPSCPAPEESPLLPLPRQAGRAHRLR